MSTKYDFEKSLARLEEIAQNLEEGNLPLNDSLKLFEEGMKISKQCESKLNAVEMKIESIMAMDINEIEETFVEKENNEKSTSEVKEKNKTTKTKSSTKQEEIDDSNNYLF